MSIAKPQTVSVEAIERDPRYWLKQLLAGQTLTLVDSEGVPVAVMISLHSSTSEADYLSWEAQWDALVHNVSRAWKSDKSAIEILEEMRR
ncbi:MAG: hypothetical protein RMK65_07305 [Anaerolineae bacterium]|nr:hypothetical protein [Anaerolineae bacterium]MCX8067989.1 hypothetical protein [Anaerolineae bacterium]MDW7991925.1 hypothetical protein [Anaerolineae bacterium]